MSDIGIYARVSAADQDSQATRRVRDLIEAILTTTNLMTFSDKY
jgi:predicted site-specific integrase-resolvase